MSPLVAPRLVPLARVWRSRGPGPWRALEPRPCPCLAHLVVERELPVEEQRLRPLLCWHVFWRPCLGPVQLAMGWEMPPPMVLVVLQVAAFYP